MAIRTTIVTERGVPFENQYVRIENVILTNKINMRIEVGVYLTEEHARTGINPHMIETVSGSFDIHSDLNVWQQGYNLIKAKWVDYIDC